MTILGFLLMVCYVPGWTGMALPTGFLFLAAVLPILLWGRVTWTTPQLAALLFLYYAIISLWWAPVSEQGIWDILTLSIIIFSFIFGTVASDSVRLYTGMALGLGISAVIALFQLDGGFGFAWKGIYQTAPAAGLFVNPDVLGETAALVTIGLISWRRLWPLCMTIPALVLSTSRTAIAICAFAALIPLWRRYRLVGAGIVLIISAVAAWNATSVMGRHYWLAGPAERLAIWQDTIDGLTIRGRGAGSFSTLYPAFASRTDTMSSRPDQAHNDYLELVFEFGVGTIPLAIVVAFAFIAGVGRDRPVVLTFLALCFIAFPLKVPGEGFIGAFALGRLIGDRDILWSDWRYRRSTVNARLGTAANG